MEMRQRNVMKRALVVDDDIVSQMAVKNLLHELGYLVTTANNGEEAVKLFNPDFSVITMDFNMPIMDGIEATRHIRQKQKNHTDCTKIIGLTSHQDQPTLNACLEAGMDVALSKPLNFDKFKKIIKDISH